MRNVNLVADHGIARLSEVQHSRRVRRKDGDHTTSGGARRHPALWRQQAITTNPLNCKELAASFCKIDFGGFGRVSIRLVEIVESG
jgi:hypothetical protein